MSGAILTFVLVVAASQDGIQRTGKDVEITWTEKVSATPAAVERALRGSPAAAVSGMKSVKHRAGGLHLVQETPFFLPEVWFDVKVVVAKDEKVTRLEWRRTAGSAKRYSRVWTLRAVPGGTEVRHVLQIEMPFNVPDVFARGQLKRQRDEDRARLKALIPE